MILETLLPQLEFQSNIEDAVKQKMIKSRRQVEEIAATAYSSNDFDFLLCKRMPLTRLVVVVYLLTQKYAEYSDIGYPDKAESCIPRMGNRQRIKVCRLHSRFNLHRRGRCDALRNLAGTQLRFLGIRSGGYAKRDRTVRQNDRQVPTG